MKRKSSVVLALALVLVALGSLAAVADEAQTQAEAQVPATAEAGGEIPVSIAGMTVFIDKETGELKQPSAEEAAALAAAMQKMLASSARLAPAVSTEQVTVTGGVALEVGPDQLNFSVATVAENGTVSFTCLDSERAAQAHVHSQVENPEDK